MSDATLAKKMREDFLFIADLAEALSKSPQAVAEVYEKRKKSRYISSNRNV